MLDILPMNDPITLYPEDEYDDWGFPTKADPIKVMGHYRYNSTRDTVVGNNGDEVVYTANVYLPVGSEVTYETTVEFEDYYGQKIEGKPIRIQPKRDIWGAPIMIRVVI